MGKPCCNQPNQQYKYMESSNLIDQIKWAGTWPNHLIS